MEKHLFLIGYMGSGKTTLGKKLARLLCVPFYDTDFLIEQNEKKSVEQIFHEQGEISFRLKELEVLNQLKKMPIGVVSTGGGFPCFNNNMQIMKQEGIVFYLQRSAKELCQRLLQNKINTRPLLSSLKDEDELLIFIENQLNQREVIYKQAHCIVERSKQNAKELVELVEFYDKNAFGSGE